MASANEFTVRQTFSTLKTLRRDQLVKSLLREIATGAHRGKFYSRRRIGRIWPVSRPTIEAAVERLIELNILSCPGPRSLAPTDSASERAGEILQTPAMAKVPQLHDRTPVKRHGPQHQEPLWTHRGDLPLDEKAPLYEHLVKSLLIEVASGAHPENGRFLSRQKIQKMWRVSGATARVATRFLLNQGLIEKHNARLHFVRTGATQKARLMLNKVTLPGLPARSQWWNKRARILGPRRSEGYRIAAILDEPRIYWDSINTLRKNWTLTDSRTQINAQWYVFSFMQEAYRHFSEITFFHDDGSTEKLQTILKKISEGDFDGVAVFQRKLFFPRKPLLSELKRRGIPVLTVLDDCEGNADVSVDFNETAAGYLGIKILLEKGHRRILFLCRGESDPADQQRMTGATACIDDLGLSGEVHLRKLPFSRNHQPKRALAQILRRPATRPTAVFSSDMLFIVQAEKTFLNAGLRVPEDLSIITTGSAYTKPQIYRPPDLLERNLAKLGQTAARKLIQMMEGKPVERTVQVTVDYLPRGTVKRVRPPSRRSGHHSKSSKASG